MKEVNIFIFRRDLRVVDNLGFQEMVQQSKQKNIALIPIFIFNPDQIDPVKNKYFSKNCVEFMIQCLESLAYDLDGRCVFFHGKDVDILKLLASNFSIQCVGFNEDYTPFAKKRDQTIRSWCHRRNIATVTREDYTLFPMGTIVTGEKQKPYEVFTPFYLRCLSKQNEIPEPMTSVPPWKSIVPSQLQFSSDVRAALVKEIHKYYQNDPNIHLAVHGGRANALQIIRRIRSGEFKLYDKERDLPAKDKTTKLSAYMKFGCVSVREVFHAIISTYGRDHGLAREIIWREFYANITHGFPRVLRGQLHGKNGAFKEKYNDKSIGWSYDKIKFARWCEGRTGFPLVDAAMRQLNTTGWMHNRCRMVVSMFLTKDLMIDWKLGEAYFAKMLVDYDPSSNNGGWQWSASTGVDSQPYFRIFNPFTQCKRFDPQAEYVKQWIPELKDVPAKDIHDWGIASAKYNLSAYPPPMVDHATQTKKVVKMFRT